MCLSLTFPNVMTNSILLLDSTTRSEAHDYFGAAYMKDSGMSQYSTRTLVELDTRYLVSY